jgi:hypothetical protein
MTQAANLGALGTNAGTTGIVATAGGGTGGTNGAIGFKNRIINGNMQIWQRGTSGTIGSYGYPSADRWAVNPFGRSTTVSQSSSVPSGIPAQYSARVQRPSGNTDVTVMVFQQTIESTNCYDLSGQSVTLSFWAKAGANFSGSYLGVQVYTGTTADQGGSTYYAWTGAAVPLSTAPTPTTTWTKYTVTGTFGSGVLEASVLFFYTPTGTAGADDAVYITDVQLEVGTAATNFDVRSIGTELQLCYRYYYYLGGDTPYQSINTVAWYTTGDAVGYFSYPVTMRIAPSIAKTGSWTTLGGGGAAGQTLSADQLGPKTVQLGFGSGSSGTSGQASTLRGNNDLTLRVTFSAEL